MAHVKGLSQSEGMKQPKPYKPGEYVVECEDWNEDDRENMLVITIRTTILEGPEQDDEGSTPEGRPFTTSIVILYENHPSYNEDLAENSIGELKDALDAFGVPMDGDSYDPEDAIEKTAKVKLGIKKPSKKDIENGYDQKRNVVRKWMPDDEKSSVSDDQYAE